MVEDGGQVGDAGARRTVSKYDQKRKQIENEVKTVLQKWRGRETVARLVSLGKARVVVVAKVEGEAGESPQSWNCNSSSSCCC